MYNLIVGAVEGSLGADRLLESVDDGLEYYVGTREAPNLTRLMTLPTLLLPEIRSPGSEEFAAVGQIAGIFRSGREYQFRFVPSTRIRPVPADDVVAAAGALNIGRYELLRTHWLVKDVDLYQALFNENLVDIPSPKLFDIPLGHPEPDLIAAMMPFEAGFDPVWKALKATAAKGGWTCQRADDIWEDSVIINDVVALIARSNVVICDLTGRNANVFYEAGIAHTIGREVILITQTQHDVPFDLTHHRHVRYLANEQGLMELQIALFQRLRRLMAN